jgi:trehalose utilization protein
MTNPIKVLCWSERTEKPQVYPEGINGAISEGLQEQGGFQTRVANLQDDGQGLNDLDWADVLIWFGHLRHRDVTKENVQRVVRAVKENGLGYVPIHSSFGARPFHAVLNHTGRSAGWREDGQPSVVNVVLPDHPIAEGFDRRFIIPQEEMYAEPFQITQPDEVVFISSFAQGEVLRSGCCWYVGKGRVFYFQPGHEAYPVYYQREIKQVLANASRWAAARTGQKPMPREDS